MRSRSKLLWSVFLDRLRQMRRAQGGVSAIEFAIVAPMLVFSVLALVDVGMALRERMMMDSVLRIGAHRALADAGEGAVEQLLATAANEQFATNIDLTVQRYCACPATPNTVVACNTTCSGANPSVFYRLSAARSFQGILLPAMAFGPSVTVQAR